MDIHDSVRQFIDEDDLKLLPASNNNVGRHHPLLDLLGSSSSQTKVNTTTAINQILRHDRSWIERLKPRILDRSDLTNAAGALAEIRAYGALLEADIVVSPIREQKQNPTPDFEISLDGIDVTIEVNSRQLSKSTQSDIDQHRERHMEDIRKKEVAGVGSRVYFSEPLFIRPFGDPGEGKTVTEVAISRLCAIKKDEKQCRQTSSNILWIDLQDDNTFATMSNERIVYPLTSWNERVTSGALWYALYGWKGAPILESFPDFSSRRPAGMKHDGRYRRCTLLSAVIASFPKSTVLLEHPSPKICIPNEFRRRAVSLPWFSIQTSLSNWRENLVAGLVKEQREMILAVSETLSQE